MAYDPVLAERIRARLTGHTALSEKQMFGGIAFMIGGNMAVGVSGNDLMVRVGEDGHDAAVARPGVRIFDLSHRPMRGWVVVSPDGFGTDADFEAWVDEGVQYAETLAPK